MKESLRFLVQPAGDSPRLSDKRPRKARATPSARQSLLMVGELLAERAESASNCRLVAQPAFAGWLLHRTTRRLANGMLEHRPRSI
jgi:hypothetical protein